MKYLLIPAAFLLLIDISGNAQVPLQEIFLKNIPHGYQQKPIHIGSFEEYINKLIFSETTHTITYNNYPAHDGEVYAIHTLPKLTSNQQCADVIMRMYSDYNLINKRPIKWTDVQGNMNVYQKEGDYAKFMQHVYNYSNTYSLYKFDSYKVEPKEVRAGDILVIPGFPGHVVLIADVISHGDDILIAIIEGYTPAVQPFLYRGEDNAIYLPFEEGMFISGYRFSTVENLRRLKD